MIIKTIIVLVISLLSTGSAFCREDVVVNKTTAVIADLLTSQDPSQYAKTHDIELKDGMIKVIITQDKKLLPEDLAAKYDLRGFKPIKNTAVAYVKFNMLKKMCEEPGVIFVRTPLKFKALSKR